MEKRNLLIIGGGVAGLSCGIHAQRSGFNVTILEHNLALGGVCTAWHRGSYVIDGCIHWLTGGPFMPLYAELGIPSVVELRTLQSFMTYRDLDSGLEVAVTRNVDTFVRRLVELSPGDADELYAMRAGADAMANMKVPLKPHELSGPRDALRSFWEMRESAGTLFRFRASVSEWLERHIKSPEVRRVLGSLAPPTAPMFFLLMILGFLERGYLSRPLGGTTAFRDALEQTFRGLGGEVVLHATADEIAVSDDRVLGVRLADGTLRKADIVVSTASTPETIFRLLGGRYEATAMRERLAHWKTFEPIVLASFGVAQSYAGMPSLMSIEGLPGREVAGRVQRQLYVRVCNDDVSFAPPGHTVVQAMLPSDYDFWATRKDRYGAEKEAVAEKVIDQLDACFPSFRESVRVIDVATPLTYWHMARSWRGAYEGWLPTADSFFTPVSKRVGGLQGLYLAGQWVAPGGGVPSAVLSGRQAAQLICSDYDRPFITP